MGSPPLSLSPHPRLPLATVVSIIEEHEVISLGLSFKAPPQARLSALCGRTDGSDLVPLDGTAAASGEIDTLEGCAALAGVRLGQVS